jgi:hypothetical protein
VKFNFLEMSTNRCDVFLNVIGHRLETWEIRKFHKNKIPISYGNNNMELSLCGQPTK